ncbi:phytoene desaturase family protein [Pseudemcibacter aquimaris]|uniref:phytoene desaturase family protein n=1 Tax=Pseudemcibacter aquimaris TaxID=2857064 RepID=UPI0020129689|nr:NAD(P)/FAD-dependent oxidoreductase [Pseudemcibacter aquimaris]MCC3862115.1 NAD(P)/FAD-dependent oxidoreductase [Pseudemcibacter aquimaris]WDU58868.1 NAD(P)/FAD-dependent oxidoreductase [Pseudemcibacter aquimaris]
MTKKNVIIIGGGHNGLVCATKLAKEGHYVNVLEARETCGGSAAKYEFANGYHAPGLASVVHPVNPKIAKSIGLKNIGTAIETISLGEDGRHLTLGINQISRNGLSEKDQKAYQDFKKEFLKYAKALEPLTLNKPPRLKDMDNKDKFTLAKLGWSLRFGLGASSMREFLRVGGINIYDVLNELFDDEQLKGAIAFDAVLGHQMGPRTPTTVLTYLNRLRGETYGGQYIPTADMGNDYKVAAEKAGVKIETGISVRKVIIENGRAVGVELENGETRTADVVVSNADAKTTFLDMVGVREMDAMFTHRISKTRTNGNVAKLNFALSKLPTFTGLNESDLSNRLIIAPDMRYIEHAFNHSKYGEISENPIIEITFPSLVDGSLASNGGHVMSVSASFAPYTLKAGWDKNKSVFAHKVLSTIEKYAPGISADVKADDILTPVDIERDFKCKGGSWHQGEMMIDQMFMMRPIHGTAQYNTPIDGLYLCGAAAHPGGGITGIPGHNAAERIINMEGGK